MELCCSVVNELPITSKLGNLNDERHVSRGLCHTNAAPDSQSKVDKGSFVSFGIYGHRYQQGRGSYVFSHAATCTSSLEWLLW
jgi:hypothetical protein